MANRTVPRVFVASNIPDLSKHVRSLLSKSAMLSKSAITVEDLHLHGVQSKDVSERLQDVEVVLCSRDALLQWLKTDTVPNLKWAQSASAGVDALMKGLNFQKPKQDFILTRTQGDFGNIMGEYVVGQIIAREKDFAGMKVYQENRVFDNQQFAAFRPLYTLSIGILGYGTIGKRVAEMCSSMGMTVWAVNSTQKTSSSPHVHHFRGVKDLGEVLQNVDYLCNILPSTPASCDLLSGEVLKQCQGKKTVLINIGRGSVINDESLVRAVREGWLGGAILDVFNQEPLPADSPLWTLPNVVITPHVSGQSFPQPLAESFVKNLELYLTGQPLLNVVDWDKGY
ncbi:glyoxylate/hydroxypyruvate reductase A-like [Babylonia areolata]|uniref:glyoxylate/hydroxypyruvate reductase A-like n=1 Tax=Babylonia areolata TaxID=304850 RepID=UPI003FD4133A